jgi:hypothetical protein
VVIPLTDNGNKLDWKHSKSRLGRKKREENGKEGKKEERRKNVKRGKKGERRKNVKRGKKRKRKERREM